MRHVLAIIAFLLVAWWLTMLAAQTDAQGFGFYPNRVFMPQIIVSPPTPTTRPTTTPYPVGSIVIDSGAETTSDRVVDLTISAASTGRAVVNMRFSTTGYPVSDWVPYATSYTLSVPAADVVNGALTVYVQFQDEAGSIGPPVSDTIRFVAPESTATAIIEPTPTATDVPLASSGL